MTPTFEKVLEQAKELALAERVKLITALSIGKPIPKNGTGTRAEKIQEFRGKYRGILPSSDEFIAAKRKELKLEDR